MEIYYTENIYDKSKKEIRDTKDINNEIEIYKKLQEYKLIDKDIAKNILYELKNELYNKICDPFLMKKIKIIVMN